MIAYIGKWYPLLVGELDIGEVEWLPGQQNLIYECQC